MKIYIYRKKYMYRRKYTFIVLNLQAEMYKMQKVVKDYLFDFHMNPVRALKKAFAVPGDVF